MDIPPAHIHEAVPQSTSLPGNSTGILALGSLAGSAKSTSLGTLPLELQVEILKELDWLDLLRARQVSRRLLLASTEKAVWTAISTRHEDERQPYSHVLEKQLSRHSAAELEEAFLKPRRTHIAWSQSTELIYRTVNVRPREIMYAILPGGRWAISTNPSGDVLCYDLDSPLEPPPHFSLVPHPVSVGYPWLSIDHSCSQGPYLTFNLATFHALPSTNLAAPYRNTGLLRVFRVEAEFDEDGRVVRLSSQLLSTFDPGPRISRLQVRGPYVSYLAEAARCIVEWEPANNKGQGFARRWILYSAEPADFLPHDLLFIVGKKLTLYNIKALPLSTDRQPPDIPIEPLSMPWHRPVDYGEDYDTMVPRNTSDGRLYVLYGPQTLVRSFFLPNSPQPTVPPITSFHIDNLTKIKQSRQYSSCMKLVEVLTSPDGRRTVRRGRLFWPPGSDGARCQIPFADIPIPSNLPLTSCDLRLSCLSIEGLSGRLTISDSQNVSWVILSTRL